MIDETPRILKIGDAISQLINVTFLPNHKKTNANESVSGRCYRMQWKKSQKFIDFIFSVWEEDHCKKSYEKDLQRCAQVLNRGTNE